MSSQPPAAPASLRFRAILAAALAAVLVAEIGGGALFAYYRVQRALAPERLADRVETAIRDNYPDVRRQVVARVERQVPQIAERVSRELRSAVPQARAELEQLTARQLERGLDTATDLSAQQFRQALRANRRQLVAAFERLEEAPEEARRLVLGTEAQLEEQFGIDLRNQARNALALHRQLNDKLERLANPAAELTAREQVERQIVRLSRGLQAEALPQTPLSQAASAPSRR